MIKKILFIPDSHIPYEDKRAFDLMLRFSKDFKPHITCILGDFADFYSVSSHDKSPSREANLKKEITAVNKRLDQLNVILKGCERKIYIEGNHEDRLRRYISTKAPELFGTIDLSQVINLDGWEFIPYKKSVTLGKLYVTHDLGYCGEFAAHKNLRALQDNIVIGHTHRMGVVYSGNAKGSTHVSAMMGWLGNCDTIDYMHRDKVLGDWQLGFGVGYLDTATGNVWVYSLPIVKYQVIFNGKAYK